MNVKDPTDFGPTRRAQMPELTGAMIGQCDCAACEFTTPTGDGDQPALDTAADAPEWVMFCTIYSPEILVMGSYTDEITPVQAYRLHLERCGKHHAPYIHMEPMREEWRLLERSGGAVKPQKLPPNLALDPDLNLFRQPDDTKEPAA